jgi:hypothetical protein
MVLLLRLAVNLRLNGLLMTGAEELRMDQQAPLQG